ncbi:MAG: DUF4139 domain-containing protein [Planctomycetota bacterium]|jgi:hypothetical protein
MKRQSTCIGIICLTIWSAGLARENTPAKEGLGLTVYNNNFAVVRDSRQMSFEEGINKKKFTDVASAIDPTSVSFQCLSAPGAVSVLEQNYEYDLVNSASLLKRYIDKKVVVKLKGSGADSGKETSGILLAAIGNDLIINSRQDNIEIIARTNVEEISLKELPEDLVTKPTLIWLTKVKEKGNQLCQVTYTTNKIGWKADYSAILSETETRIDFSGWVTINNQSGASYKDATIKLIAGDVRRVTEPQPIRREKLAVSYGAKAPAFEEKQFMEYHLYTLGRKSTINNNQVKQIEFITPATGVPVDKLYIYERSKKPDKVQVKLEFENLIKNSLGIALPKGKVRVFKKDPADDMLEFVGEDMIDHTPRKEKLSLYIGNAFDIVPEYKLVDSKSSRRMKRQTHEIELRNRKKEVVEVFVDESFPSWVNWKIDQQSHKHEKRDANTIRFALKIAADSTVAIQYTVTQTW